MSNVQIDSIQTAKEIHSQRSAFLRKIGSWFCVWEIYPILGIAAFLRFYQITTTEFDADQALIFQMARDAINHGLIPATGIIASIRIANPPAVVYLFMIPAAISSNPIWGAIFVGLLNVIGVLLTYIFVRRYYGRIASIIASLLYATAAEPLHFNRFIWQLNIIAPFVVLFIFALFWGVVDRRKGWLFPALVLLGILIQLHITIVILSSLLLVALVLSPGTARLRDLTLGLIFLLLLFSTYLLWEFSIKFADLKILLQISKLHSHFDLTVLNYYGFFLNPYVNIPTNTHSLEYILVPLLKWLSPTMAIFIVCGLALITVGVISSPQLWKRDSGVDEESRASRHSVRRSLETVRTLWTDFRATPQRCGYFLLFCWQIVPVIILSRHSVPVFPYYLLMVLPGPFIIIGILLSTLGYWFQRQGGMWKIAQYGICVCTCLVIVSQLLGSTAVLIDEASGNNLHGYSYNTLNSYEDALNEADQLATLHHLNHVYIATDQYTQNSLGYLAEQMRTPTTLFDASRCLVLPNAAAGPAELLVGPYDKLSMVLLSHFGFIRSASPNSRTSYTFAMRALLNGNGNGGLSISSRCVSTSMRTGDQLIVAFQLPEGVSVPASLNISATYYVTIPLDLSYGPIHLENIRDQNTQPTTLQTTEGRTGITLSTSSKKP